MVGLSARMAMRLNSLSLQKKFSMRCRPWSGLWPGSESPFCALSVAMDLDDGGIDHGVLHVGLVRTGIEQLCEDIGLTPIAEAPECRAPVPEHRRKVTPRAACARGPQNSLNEKPVVVAAAPGSVALPRQCGSICPHWASVNTNRSIQSLNHIQAKA